MSIWPAEVYEDDNVFTSPDNLEEPSCYDRQPRYCHLAPMIMIMRGFQLSCNKCIPKAQAKKTHNGFEPLDAQQEHIICTNARQYIGGRCSTAKQQDRLP